MFIRIVPVELCLIIVEFYILSGVGYKPSVFRIPKSGRLVLIYLLICIIPFSSIVTGHFDINFFTVGIRGMVLPILLFFTGQIYVSYTYDEQQEIKKKWLNGIVFSLVIGLALHVINPSFYHDYIRKAYLYSSSTDIDIYFNGRAPRFFGIYLTSQMAGISGIAAECLAVDVFKNNEKKKCLYLFICAITVYLAYQRACWVLFVVVLLFDIVKNRRKSGLVFRNLLFIVTATLGLVVLWDKIINVFTVSKYGEYQRSICQNITSLTSIFTERYSNDYARIAIEDFKKSPIIGNGLAYSGHSLDANYHRVLADLGLLGLVSLLAIILKTIYLTVKDKELDGLGLVAMCVAINSLGAPMLDSVLIGGFYFWMMIGCQWESEYEQRNILVSDHTGVQYRKVH